jgi:hypothetical protein
VLGDTGTGKTHACLEIIRGYLTRSPGYALVVDWKGEHRFTGQRYASAGELQERPPAPEPRVLVFGGNVWRAAPVSPDEVAAVAWQLAQLRVATLQVHDELGAVTTAGQWKSGTRWIPQTFTMGRSHRCSILWGTQMPQDAPREAFEQSDEIWAFRLSGLALDLLGRRGYLAGINPLIIQSLPGSKAPPEQRGKFVRLVRGESWDGRVYRF